MKKSSVFFCGLVAIVFASATFTTGQERKVMVERDVLVPGGPAIVHGQEPGGATFTFVTSEFSFDKLVKGAPYSAQAVTETTQTLSDGNRIINTSSAAVYRDGEGRTRREQTLKAIGNFSPSDEPFKTISINDPVAGIAYVLEPHSHTARKTQGFRMAPSSPAEFTMATPGGGAAVFTFSRTPNGEMQTKQGTPEVKMREQKERTGFRKEDLGSQTIEGVNAVGTRSTITIPAGQIGNERAIEIVDEKWYSPDLQTMVMTRHSDPRSGETVFRLTNINRVEPDPSLFTVPTDYNLRDDGNFRYRLDKKIKPDEQ